MIDEQKFFAWLDGELEPAEAAEVERQVASDPQLARLAQEHRAMANGLRSAFASVEAAPIPDALRPSEAARDSNVVQLSWWRRALARPLSGPLPQVAAMAATLVLGLLIGTSLNDDGSGSPIETRGGQIYAAGKVEQALERQLASAGSGGDVRIGLTFRNGEGTICRSFETGAAAGLACRDGEDWRLRGLFGAPEGAQSEYRMAAGSDPRLMELVDSEITSDPFDAEAERSARESGWR